MMFKSPTIRLSLALVLLTVNLLLVANLIGLIPDRSEIAIEMRKGLSESLALQFTAVANKGDMQIIQNTLREVVERNKDIRSAAIRTNDNQLIALAGEHLAHWTPQESGKSTPTHISVPLYRNRDKWATVEIRFAPLWANNLASGFHNSFVPLLVFVSFAGFFSFFFVIKRTLRELDPKAVIPDRVQNAFNVLKEGVLILDEKEQIVMANNSFAELFETTPDKMIGLKGSELGWLNCQNPQQVKQLPWFITMNEGLEQKGASLSLTNSYGKEIKLAVNAAMVNNHAGKCRGCLVTFDDITQLEEQNFELNNLVENLRLSNDENLEKSQELEFLANHDPMTHCLNRRCLDRNLDLLFNKMKANNKHLSCLMVDIDHFKSVNDRFGHAIGDQVIKTVAEVLKTSTRDSDHVGRYGGEEFCIVLPDLDQVQAAQIAERIRHTIENDPCSGVNITVSLGVSSLEHKATKPDELVNQADKALYAAKQSGRNRVVKWGVDDLEFESAQSVVDGVRGSKQGDHNLEAQLEKRLLEFEHYEMYDSKTGLPTRSLFEDRVTREISRGKRQDYLVAVLSITMDTIKRVHETFSQNTAESLIKACGHRLNDVLRDNIDTVAVIEEGMSTISLINQTEFAVLLTEIKQVDNITWVIKRLLDSFDIPFKVDGQDIYVSAYIGVSIFPHDGQTVAELYSSSINASSHAQKSKNINRYLFSSQELNKIAVRHLQVESALHGAIQNDELELYYQPQIETATGQIGGIEALLRWNNPELGIISPGDIVSISESSRQINRLGDWVVYHACQQMRNWLDMGIEVGRVGVNLSGIQLQQQNLPLRIQNILEEFKLSPQLLEIELTESSLVHSHDNSFNILKQINDMGIRVTLDDFGTGYSSLSYLKNIPLSCVKIDKSFTADIGKDNNSEKLIASIVSMAHGLGLEVVAEGVEEKEQVDHLTALGCEYLQGYYFSKPLPHSEVLNYHKSQIAI